ncbi:MAG: SDR family NAD(P)-dependent oxidoreductase [Actinobacteria bacterium]|nr:SDR family NAD(P)-dependent oxidoreductase [Actinomycetota bacterium]
MRLDGSVAMVFGGASGLGEATAHRLAAGGATVVVADRATDSAGRVAKRVGGSAVTVDVVDQCSVGEAVSRACALGPLRVVVTCAGVATPTKLLSVGEPTPLEGFAEVIEVNLLGTINVLQYTAGAMLKNQPTAGGERGVCVTTASIAAFDGQIGQVAYAASKGGVVGLTLPVARELASKGVRVVTIAPGLFDTPMMEGLPESTRKSLAGTVPFPPRLGDPDEYAALVEHVVGNQMLNGEVIRLDGALRMAPR